MRNILKHLTLLTRMKDDGLLPTLTGSFSEDAIAQACGQVETLQLQERLHIRKTKRIQEELVRVPDFAALYGTLCRQEIGDEEIASALESADGYGERLTAYPQEQVLAVMKLELLRLGELPHSTCLSYRTGSQRECLLAAFDSNKKIVLVKKDEAVVARACLRLTKGAFQKPPAVDFSFADLSQENMDIGKPVTSEKPVLFLESIYTFGLNDIEKEEVMKLAVSLTTQKAAELGVVAVLARRYLGCYERDEYVLAPFYVYISKSKNGWQYLDSLGGAAYTSAKEEYVEHPFLVMQTAMHQAESNSRNEVYYE